MINIAILGYGTVGSGVGEIINKNCDVVKFKTGEEVNIKYVLERRSDLDFPIGAIITSDFSQIINDSSVKIIVEVMGGVNPAYSFVKQALILGKNVVTSNKELVAKHGAELLSIAAEKNVNFFFEASVGGGIPIIKPLCTSLTSEKILEITGILNGTTNYILTEMTNNDMTFEDVLKTAQDLGYAERDPAADVEGYDACRKIAILTSLAFGKTVNYEEISTEGITKITSADISYAKLINSCIKLVGTSRNLENGIFARVSPVIFSMSHPLSMVNGVYNAIFIKGNMLGDTMYYGSGAGKLPTASAVVSDIIEAGKHLNENLRVDWSKEMLPIMSIDEAPVKALVRIAFVVGQKEIAVNLAKESFKGGKAIELDGLCDEFGFITDIETEKELKEKTEMLCKNEAITEIRNIIRMED